MPFVKCVFSSILIGAPVDCVTSFKHVHHRMPHTERLRRTVHCHCKGAHLHFVFRFEKPLEMCCFFSCFFLFLFFLCFCSYSALNVLSSINKCLLIGWKAHARNMDYLHAGKQANGRVSGLWFMESHDGWV